MGILMPKLRLAAVGGVAAMAVLGLPIPSLTHELPPSMTNYSSSAAYHHRYFLLRPVLAQHKHACIFRKKLYPVREVQNLTFGVPVRPEGGRLCLVGKGHIQE